VCPEANLAKEKIVRCLVKKNGTEAGPGSVRYIPLEIFGLWKNLMVARHGFAVEEDCTSLWFDIDGDPHVNYADTNYDKVVRLSIWVYSDSDGMFRKVTRFFPLEGYDDIKPCFLAHYSGHFSDERFPARIEETHGVWLKQMETRAQPRVELRPQPQMETRPRP
jgi:hypothetical protein